MCGLTRQGLKVIPCQACPSLIVAQSGVGDGFFISSVEDSVLARSAALESLCFGIGFDRLELIHIFMYLYIAYIIVLFAIRFLRKSDYCPLFARRVRCS